MQPSNPAYLHLRADLSIARRDRHNQDASRTPISFDTLRRQDLKCKPEDLIVPVDEQLAFKITDVKQRMSVNDERTRYVYRACAVVVNRLHEDEIVMQYDVVCKVGYHKAQLDFIRDEAKIYEKHFLTPGTMGQVVPTYMGLFVGDTYEGMTTVLVLEDCGRPLLDCLSHYSLEFRIDVIAALTAVHMAGVTLPGFYEENIVVKKRPGETKYTPIIVDFSCAHSHECFIREDNCAITEVNVFVIDCHSFPCGDLRKAYIYAELWIPSEWSGLYGHVVPH
ncbi:hypothetical protein FKP32DRAFT_182796 [Trametes sanguinea]|nr:hypothetical protein FKP32DRAFT_182796 [Trametes sanguinea]